MPRPPLRSVVCGDNPDPDVLLHGSHEGKTTEALLLCHAAGWPARIVTPEELKRGLDSRMKTILLVGLNQFDSSWIWSEGLKDSLQKFVDNGGRILVDDESVLAGCRDLDWDEGECLVGSPTDNVLIMDQDRGYLLPAEATQLKPGQGIVCPTFSPFVGECQAINLIAPDVKGLQAAVDAPDKPEVSLVRIAFG